MPLPKDEAYALRRVAQIVGRLFSPQGRAQMARNVEGWIQNGNPPLSFRLPEVAVLFYPDDPEKAGDFQRQMEAAVRAGELLLPSSNVVFISDLAAWPGCPPVPPDSPLSFWLPAPKLKSFWEGTDADSQPSVPPPAEEKEVEFDSSEQLKRLAADMTEAARAATENYVPPVGFKEQIVLNRVNRTSAGWDALRGLMDERKISKPMKAKLEPEKSEWVAISKTAVGMPEAVKLAAGLAPFQESNQGKPFFPFGYSNGKSRLVIRDEPENRENQVKSTGSVRSVQRDQEAAIINELKLLGIEPKSMPPYANGKNSVKSTVRSKLAKNPLFSAKTAFKKAWERLTEFGEIAYSANPPPPKK